MGLSWRTAGLGCSELDLTLVFSCLLVDFLSFCAQALASPDTCRTPPHDMPVKCEKTCRETLFFFRSCLLKSQFVLRPNMRASLSASGISHSPVMLPCLSLPPVKGHEVSGSTEGQALWAGAFPLPGASCCVVWFVLTSMRLYESSRAVCCCYGFNSFLLLLKLTETPLKHTALQQQNNF